MATIDIPITHVFTRRDARKIDEAAVRGLIASIREIGIINPLRVRPTKAHVNGVEGDAYEVVAGAHRLRAARKVGLETVPCSVVEDDDLHAELAMIDENLCRAELSAADRAKQTARRKAIYEKLHHHGKART
jgi:ParB family chromosome partitioning protein